MNTQSVKSAAVKVLAAAAIGAATATAANLPTGPFEMTANFGASFYVATTGSDAGDGSENHPFATISNAVEKAAAAIDLNGGSAVIHLAAGTYNETGFVLDRPIVVIGDDRDTVNIYDAVAKSRAFQLSHDDAAVMNLTISGTGYAWAQATGGHVQLLAGTVENCIIRDGYVNQSDTNRSGGGNVFISGGRLLRCQVLDGRLIMNGAYNSKLSYGAGIYATGGVVDSCLVKGGACNQNSRCGGVYVDGTAKIVNCTIVDNKPSSGGNDMVSAGIYVASASATVANSVFYGNGDNSAAANFATVNLGRFFNCASAEGNPSCAAWKVVTADDFADYATGNYRSIAGSRLVDAGSREGRPEGGAPLDLDGNNRISGVEVDIGAWEYDQSGFSFSGYPSSYAMLEQATTTFSAAAAGPSSDVVFRWDYGNGVTEDTRETAHAYRYPEAGLFTVRLAASPDGGVNWGEWYTVPTRVVVAADVMYVDSNCATPVFPYKTKATAATTLAAALNALTNNVSGNVPCVDGVEVRIVKGSRLTETGMRLECAMAIVGDTDNPNDAEIVDAVQQSRAFVISHPQARVANLKISGTGYAYYQSTGGHVQLFDGTVENCIIRDGYVNQSSTYYSGGGNVYISGGRLLRCQVLDGRLIMNGAYNSKLSYGAGIYATGGVVDSCLVRGGACYKNSRCGGVYVDGTAKIVNCTIIDNKPSSNGGDTESAGIYVASANATVANCVIYSNGVNSAAANFATVNLDRFFYCASSETNASCATWKVIDETAFNNWSRRDENVKYLSPKNGGALIDSGSTWSEYVETYGGTATVDLLGNGRKNGRNLDIGCIELKRFGSVYYLR